MASPLQTASVRRKVIYLGVILGLFTLSLFWRGKFAVPLRDEGRVVALNQVRRGGT
jgi:hypothetical protein